VGKTHIITVLAKHHSIDSLFFSFVFYEIIQPDLLKTDSVQI